MLSQAPPYISPIGSMRRVAQRLTRPTAILLAAAMLQASAQAASLDGLAVDVQNRSEPVLCAEKDNVTIAVSNPQVRSFRIEAAHPAYAGMIQRDSFEADWTACDMSADPVYKAPVPPRQGRRQRMLASPSRSRHPAPLAAPVGRDDGPCCVDVRAGWGCAR